MKIRWTRNSVRFRITPTELNALLAGQDVCEVLDMPGLSWAAAIRHSQNEPDLAVDGNHITVFLDSASINRLFSPDTEGVYFNSQLGVCYYIEKDFPCAHPHSSEAGERATERFQPTGEFERRKSG